MNTIIFKEDIGVEKYKMVVRVLEAMGIEVVKNKEIDYSNDNIKMSKEVFFAMIDESRESKKISLTEELRKELFGL
ncbi:hypothetical protein KRX57_09925 [Weeksellaceae bacterium TAE3-ERU29]|nr:hypothetical protein [Weeksellaceae bacterium TAE3-ERU29]